MAQAKAKSNSVFTTEWSGDILTITALGAGSVMFDRTSASAANRDHAEKHGWGQRLVDKAAKSAPKRAVGMSDQQWMLVKQQHTQARLESVEKLIGYYEGGEVPWRMAGAGGISADALLLDCMCILKPNVSRAKIGEWLKSKSAEYRAGLLISDGVKPVADQLRAARAAAVDTNGALDELDALDSDEDMDDTDAEIAELMSKD